MRANRCEYGVVEGILRTKVWPAKSEPAEVMIVDDLHIIFVEDARTLASR